MNAAPVETETATDMELLPKRPKNCQWTCVGGGPLQNDPTPRNAPNLVAPSLLKPAVFAAP